MINSARAFSYSSGSMVTMTSTCPPPAICLYSSVTNKACKRASRVPSVYILHRFSRAEILFTWTLRHTQPSVIWIKLAPEGSTQVLTAVMSWSYVESRVNSSKLEAIVKPPATALNRVFMFNTKTPKKITYSTRFSNNWAGKTTKHKVSFQKWVAKGCS